MENKRDALTLRCDGIRLVYEMQELESSTDAVEALTDTILSGICRLSALSNDSTYEIRQAIKESYNKIIADTSLFEKNLNYKMADDEALIADKKDYELALIYGPSVEVNGLGVD